MANVKYNDKSDVLYISVGAGKPRPGVAEEIDNGIFVKKNGHKVVGITIMYFLEDDLKATNDRAKEINKRLGGKS